MSLKIDLFSKDNLSKNDVLLKNYLITAVSSMKGLHRNTVLTNGFKNASLNANTETQNLSPEFIEKTQKEIDSKIKGYSLKAKLNYFADGTHTQYDEKMGNAEKRVVGTPVLSSMAGAAVGAVVAVAAIAVNASTGGSIDSGSIANACMIGGAALGGSVGTAIGIQSLAKIGEKAVQSIADRLSSPNSDAEWKDFKDFADLKHAQFALKQLKKTILANRSGYQYAGPSDVMALDSKDIEDNKSRQEVLKERKNNMLTDKLLRSRNVAGGRP